MGGRRGQEERMKDEDREQMQGRLRREREKQRAGERVGESSPFGNSAGVSFMSSMLGSEAVSPSWAWCACVQLSAG